MALPPLVSADALLARLGIAAPSAAETESAEQRVGAASATFRRLAGGQVISLVTDDEVTLDGDGSRLLLLPQYPVIDLTAVVVDGEDVTADVAWSARGIIRREAGFPAAYRSVVVIYSHGVDPVPDDVADNVLDLAEASQRLPAGIDSMQLGATSWRRGSSLSVRDAAARYGSR